MEKKKKIIILLEGKKNIYILLGKKKKKKILWTKNWYQKKIGIGPFDPPPKIGFDTKNPAVLEP